MSGGSHLDHLRASRGSGEAAWLQTVTQYTPDQGVVFVFTEGRDDIYYVGRMELLQPKLRIVPINCRGKKHVMSALRRVRPMVRPEWRAVFYVDRDLDSMVPHSEPLITDTFLFVTTPYSIENYVIRPEAPKVIWHQLFGLEHSDRFVQFRESFNVSLGGYLRRLRRIMAWILVARRKNPGGKITLKDFKLDEVIAIQVGPDGATSRLRRWMWPLLRICGHGVTAPPTRAEVNAARKELAQMDPLVWARGKFVMLWLARFIQCWQRVVERPGQDATQRAKPRFQINAENAFDYLSTRMPEPDDLSAFLRKWAQAVSA